MSTLHDTAVHPRTDGQPLARKASAERAQRQVGLAFVSLYAVFLVLFGILPSAYAIFLAFTKRNAFIGVDNFVKVFKDYRFLPAVVSWLSTSVRFLSYVPGGVMLWLFVFDRTVSPVSFLLPAIGFGSFVETVQADHLPVTLAIIAFWTGAGGWIIVMYGALNNISRDAIEAARGDGAGPIRTAWSIQIPLLRKWIA